MTRLQKLSYSDANTSAVWNTDHAIGDLALEDVIDDSGDPPRVWLRDGNGQILGGMAFSRSLGDTLGKDVGVTYIPEVFAYKLDSSYRVVTLASDGIWEFITNKKAAMTASRFSNPVRSCRCLVGEAYAEWLPREGRTDDITAVVALLEWEDELPVSGINTFSTS